MLAVAGTAAWMSEGGMIVTRTQFDQCEIITLAVSPAKRRQGIAASLLAHAMAEARKAGALHMFLEVAEDNAAAQKLYESAGFAVTHRRKDYYKNGAVFTDALVMTRELA